MVLCSVWILRSPKNAAALKRWGGQAEVLRAVSTSVFPQYANAKTGFGKGPNARVQAEPDKDTLQYLKDNDLKYQQHPGVFHLNKVSLPEKIRQALKLVSSHENIPAIVEGSEELRDYLWLRQLPIEDQQYRDKAAKLETKFKVRDEVLLPFLSKEETVKLEKKRYTQIVSALKREVYHWEPIEYSRQRCFEYIFGRSAGEYASLCRIFNEISMRDPAFKPTTLCDFGSGIGTVSWAARQFWSSSLVEHLCADISTEMNELAELILRGGVKNNDHPIPALFFRYHLPESHKIRYDLVVSAFSLMELSSAKARLETIDKLWNKTDGYLVLVESGTKAGFRAIQEARDYILRLGLQERVKKSRDCHVFSPCPHSMECPRFNFDTIPCNFSIKYRPVYPFHEDDCSTLKFSYVVLRRGYPNPKEENWPRIVEKPLVRPRHVICRLCTKDAKLSEITLTKAKHSQDFRLLIKRSHWGDVLPVHLSDDGTHTKPTADNLDEEEELKAKQGGEA